MQSHQQTRMPICVKQNCVIEDFDLSDCQGNSHTLLVIALLQTLRAISAMCVTKPRHAALCQLNRDFGLDATGTSQFGACIVTGIARRFWTKEAFLTCYLGVRSEICICQCRIEVFVNAAQSLFILDFGSPISCNRDAMKDESTSVRLESTDQESRGKPGMMRREGHQSHDPI